MDGFSRREHHLSKEQQTAIDSSAATMTEFYPHRGIIGLLGLNRISPLRKRKGRMAVDTGTVHTDGHYDGSHGAASCIVEVRNKVGGSNSVPVVDLISYAAHSHTKGMDHPNGLALFQGWRAPCLALTIIGKLNPFGSSDESDVMHIVLGPHIAFYAMVFLGEWHVVGIAMLPCIKSPSESDDRQALYAAFCSPLDLLVRIDANATRFIDKPPKLEHGESRFPYISQLRRYDNALALWCL